MQYSINGWEVRFVQSWVEQALFEIKENEARNSCVFFMTPLLF